MKKTAIFLILTLFTVTSISGCRTVIIKRTPHKSVTKIEKTRSHGHTKKVIIKERY